ncbi:MAG: 2'-5' RNA ligase family protein [Leptolyngbyaceae cyanobacterium bins.349]|nr:2'-5' RNA ligase family protein [Leptolyngbyaceae cyanobacterium bins.349]
MQSDAKRRFFIALIPPQALQDQANQIKQYVADRYHSRAAQKSPPHITLQAPFEWSVNDYPQLEQQLTTFAAQQDPIALTLDGFAAFPPRVIFIDVERSPALLTLQSALTGWLEDTLGIVDRRAKGRDFAPHLTVAFRDLTKPNFKLAWQEFQGRSLHFEWVARDLTLLIHDGQCWQIYQNFSFNRPPLKISQDR